MQRILRASAAALLGLFAPAGLVAFGIFALLEPRNRAGKAFGSWVGLWLPLLGLAGLQSLLGRPAAGGYLVGLGTLGLFAAWVLGCDWKGVARGLFISLAVFALVGLFGVWQSRFYWQGHPVQALVTNMASSPPETLHQGRYERRWYVPRTQPPVRLALQARLEEGTPASTWYLSSPDIRLSQHSEQNVAFTRIVTPPGGDPYLLRLYRSEKPLAGRTFRAEVRLRAPTGVTGLLLLQEEGGTFAAGRQAVTLQPDWQTYSVAWRVPESVTTSVLRVVLNDFNGYTFDVGEVVLEEQVGDAWTGLGPLEPTGVALSVSAGGQILASSRFLPRETWETYQLALRLPDNARATLKATLTVEPGITVAVRNISLDSDTAGRVGFALPAEQRQAFWFEHDNLAGHSLATLGLLLVSVTRTLASSLLGLSLALTAVGFTGSRAAWLAAVIGLPWLLWLRYRPRRQLWLLGTAALGIALVTFGLPNRLRTLEANNPVSRPDIWRVAWQGFLEHPWTGVGTNFPDYWRETYRGASSEIVPHAHNLWLQFAAVYGLPGLVAVLWLTGCFLYLAWTWGRWRGLALVVPVFVMNLFDYTFFYSGVLFPLILGVNALRQGRTPTQAKP